MTIYKFNGQTFTSFADLANAFFAVKGYWPSKPANDPLLRSGCWVVEYE